MINRKLKLRRPSKLVRRPSRIPLRMLNQRSQLPPPLLLPQLQQLLINLPLLVRKMRPNRHLSKHRLML